jgi:carbon storage regulator
MLVLTRKEGEQIRIGNSVTITLVCVNGDRARIGIDAPENIPIDREEIAIAKINGVAPKKFKKLNQNQRW